MQWLVIFVSCVCVCMHRMLCGRSFSLNYPSLEAHFNIFNGATGVPLHNQSRKYSIRLKEKFNLEINSIGIFCYNLFLFLHNLLLEFVEHITAKFSILLNFRIDAVSKRPLRTQIEKEKKSNQRRIKNGFIIILLCVNLSITCCDIRIMQNPNG